MKHPRLFRLINVGFATMLVALSTSCMSIYMRKNARNSPPPNPYPAVRTLYSKLSEKGNGGGLELKPGTFGEHCVVGAIYAVGGVIGGAFIIDIPLSLVLDTVLLPTDLLFEPGAIIAQEPSKHRLYENMQNAVYNAYQNIAEETGVRYTVNHHRYSFRSSQAVRLFAFTLDSDIEGFSEKGQLLYEARHSARYWKDENGQRLLVYSVFWLNPKNQKLLFLFLPTDSDSIQHSVFASSKEHSKSIRKYFSERLASEIGDTHPKFPNYSEIERHHRYNEGLWVRMSGEEATSAITVAREKYREITGGYPSESLSIDATEKFVLFDGDRDPPSISSVKPRIEVLITERYPPRTLKAMLWIEPTTNANPVIDVLYPIIPNNENPHQ